MILSDQEHVDIHWAIVYDMQQRLHCVVIKTLEGEMECEIGDWVIKGIKNECPRDLGVATQHRITDGILTLLKNE